MAGLLLDTCVLVMASAGKALREEARAQLRAQESHISVITAWEVGNLVRKNRLAVAMPVASWLSAAASGFRASWTELTVDILIHSCDLPGTPPSDPSDRIIIATARDRGLVLMTTDRQILSYAEAGHVRALAC